jgi:hypothetical protein
MDVIRSTITFMSHHRPKQEIIKENKVQQDKQQQDRQIEIK